MSRPKNWSISVLAIPLGLLFVIAGTAKFFWINPFSQTIASITHLSPSTAKILAITVVTAEVIGGVALLLRYKTGFVAVALCLLTSVFIWVLSAAVSQDREIICNCFGILNVNLSNHVELTLDLILFDLLAVLALLEGSKRARSVNRTLKQKLYMFGTAGVVLYMEIGLVVPAFQRANKYSETNVHPAISFAAENSDAFASITRGNRLLFLLHFHDFSCPLCFDDIISLCDSIDTNLQENDRNRVVALFHQDDIVNPANPTRVLHWASANGITFPVLIAPDSLFAYLGIKKSTVAVVNAFAKTVFFREIPIGEQRRQDVLRYLAQPK